MDSRARGRRPFGWREAAVVCALVAALGALAAWALLGDRPDPTAQATGVEAAGSSVESGVEVPDVEGASVAEAIVIVEAAGLVPVVDGSANKAAEDRVVLQEPAAGEVVAHGAELVLSRRSSGTRAKPLRGVKVVVDPGHQRRSDMSPEPIGPGSDETRARATGGTSGVETGMAEYEVVLQISMNLSERLRAAGAEVVMTRTTNDVSLGNRERAEMANDAGADVFIRVHANGSPSAGAEGIRTLYPSKNRWTARIARRSRLLAASVQRSVVAAAGGTDQGLEARGDLAGFNYSKVPVVLVECGYLSNPVEDRLLTSPHYQDKLAEGIVRGVVAYVDAE